MADAIKKLGQSIKDYGESIPSAIKNATADYLLNSDFLSRQIGMANSYEDIMFVVQALGYEPVSLLGKDYTFIFDHVRRNYSMGTNVMNYEYGIPKFTFYKEKPTVKFANPYDDPMNLLDRWIPDITFESTSQRNILFSYAESDDDYINNKEISTTYDIDGANPGINFGGISSFANTLPTQDMIKKTNDNFNHGKYRTLIARFHTNSLDSKDKNDITQTAISEQFGMSHGRNLLRKYSSNRVENGYDNPYCRVWTYHHQYNQIARAIRPFDLQSAEMLERGETSGEFNTVGFRTLENKDYGFKGGSSRLDDYGVLNYKNGLVNIAPTAKIKDYFEQKTDKEVTIKKCMFSIENLAWRSENIKMNEYDQYGLSPEQKGPLGGRIMWFPPYDLSFSENVNVNWNPNQFIGRGEKVYTYTDTERTGNLSFTLLIDHPSILDYWTGHKRNGMKNQGTSLVPGNGGGVDEKNNQENTLLRFFAGCEILTAKPQEFKVKVDRPEAVEDVPTPAVDEPQEVEVHDPTVEKKTIYCVLYFPNNYSGVDDAPNNSMGTVNAIYYLMNGIGAQKYVDDKNDASDIPTQIDNAPGGAGSGYGGYELRNAGMLHGISIAIANLNANYEQISSTYVDLKTKDRKAQRLTSPAGGAGYKVTYGSTEYELAKIVGSQAMSLGGAHEMSNLTGSSHLWYRGRWYYRVDKAYENDKLSHTDSYLDLNDFGLNGNGGYKKLKSKEQIAKAFGLTDSDENVTLVSFADLFTALEGVKVKSVIGDGNVDEENVNIISSIINDPDRFNITSIKFEGHASFQGTNAANNTLSKNRALTFKKWMQSKGFPNVDDASIGSKNATSNSVIDQGGNSTLDTKMWRSASVIIEYEESISENAALAESTIVEDGKTDEKTGAPLNKVDKVEIANGINSNKIKPIDIGAVETKRWQDENQKKMSESLAKITGINFDNNGDDGNIEDKTINNISDNDNTNTPDTKNGVVERYDNEGEFFELLEKNDPFMHHLITDKIRYFDPAFHSISPEGFNARLTFLHQCTRQGSTVGSSDNQFSSTAYNLAFGRPPICVLRLGDFYYTKIIINSIDIQYETPQWDLNPEGIGVMPMFAKISMRFVFLGGSDLAGPISRLQNAVSFNYYANTGVYDNRAEMVQYDSDGNGRETKFKPFSYPDMLRTNGVIDKKLSGDISFDKPKVVEVNDSKNSPFVDKNAINGETIRYSLNDKNSITNITPYSQQQYQAPTVLNKPINV
jgi:hypothetical protein